MSSPLYERIYALVRRIPEGKAATYGQIAFLLGLPRGARTVGFAMAACRDPSVPCHRVVNRFGGTTPAFDPPGGSGVQRMMLESEGVCFDGEGRVDLNVCGWDGENTEEETPMVFDNNDRRIRHFELMLCRSLDDLPVLPLPAGYRFVRYAPGDRDAWIRIEESAREFDSFEEGEAAWARYYGDREDELPGRMLFVESDSGEKVATATAMYDVFGRDTSGSAWLHWVSVRRDRQGLGLSKPLICEAFRVMKSLGYTRVVIPTQTNTWLAVKVYLDLGCRPIPENAVHSETGWRIARTLTEHPALASFPPVGLGDILAEERNP